MASEIRYAHSEGQTFIAYHPNGRQLLSAGADGDVRVYDGFEDDDPRSFRVGERVYALAVKDDCVATALDINTIQLHTYPEARPDGLAARFTSPAYSIVFSHSGEHLAAGGSEFVIKVPVVRSPSKVKVLRGHEAPVLSLAFDSQDEHLASSSCDGTVRVWQWKDETCVKTLKLLEKGNDLCAVRSLCGLSWQPKSGELLAIPVENGVQMLKRGSWEHSFTLSCPNEEEVVNVVAWTPSGEHIAAATILGNIFVWDMKKHSLVESLESDPKVCVCSMVWHPKGLPKLAFADVQGQVGLWEDMLEHSVTLTKSGSQLSMVEDVPDDDMDALMAGMEDDLDVSADIAKIHQLNSNQKKSEKSTKKNKHRKAGFLDDSASESGSGSEDDDEDAADHQAAAAMETDGKDWLVEDNMGSPGLPPPLGEFPSGEVPLSSTPAPAENKTQRRTRVEVVSAVSDPQSPFQPGSTLEEGDQYFMVYNDVGIVQYNIDEDQLSSIDVEFHDTAIHHPMHLPNHFMHTMAALSSQALVLAGPAQGDNHSKLECHHFGAWDGSREWIVSLPKKEDVQTLACSTSLVAVATSHNLLRVWSLSGVQWYLSSIPGPVVAMAAWQEHLAVVYHQGAGLPGQQNLGCQVYHLRPRQPRLLHSVSISLSPKSTLTWLGFSSAGLVCITDSCGLLKMLVGQPQPTWLPATDLRHTLKSKHDHYWVVSVADDVDQIRCILCKGATYPSCQPRPILALLPFQPPLCDLTTEKAQLESEFLRHRLLSLCAESCGQKNTFSDHTLEAAIKDQTTALVKLFALACKSDREARAADVCELMPTDLGLSLAVRYASRVQRISLAQRIDELQNQRAEEEEEEEEEEDLRITSSYPINTSYLRSSSVTAPSLSEDRSSTHSYQRSQPQALLHGRHRLKRDIVRIQSDDPLEDNSDDEVPSPKNEGKTEDMQDDINDDVDEDFSSSTTPHQAPGTPVKKGIGGLATGVTNPFQMSGSSKAPPPFTPERGGSYLDRLSSASPIGIHKREMTEKQGKSGSARQSSGQKVQASLLSSLTGKPIATKSDSSLPGPSKRGRPKSDSKGAADVNVKAFGLWFTEQENSLREEHPDVGEDELKSLASQRWEKLDEDTKQDAKPKRGKRKKQEKAADELSSMDTDQAESSNPVDEPVTKKAKADIGADVKGVVAKSAASSAQKLAGFAFGK